MQSTKWKVLQSKHLLKNKYVRIRVDKCLTCRGQKIDYFVFEQPDFVTIVAFTRDNKLILQRQYRHPVKKWIWQMPAGRIEKGESLQKAARRELLEETGYKTGSKIISLPFLHPSIGRSDQKAYTVIMRDCVKVAEPKLEPGEDLETRLVTFDEALKMIKNGKLQEINSVVAFLMILSPFNKKNNMPR
jgi:8-oxo-dGTP pyrophosphatase MutT (NUDIX family)